ncbi:MAG: 50S ribosomal protein L21 [bacterium]
MNKKGTGTVYAVAENGGRQYFVEPGGLVSLDRQGITALEKILFIKEGERVLIGQPYLKNAKVQLEFADETKARKVVSFKKKRRKGYRRKIGHRQKYFIYKVKNIISGP